MTAARILVVEDERVVARDIQYRLTEMGHTVVNITRGGDEAVRLAEELRPDLVLMDIRLDGRTDGISAAQEIRSRFHLPIVFLTAYADEDTLHRARVAEPFGYVLKPFDERELRTVIEMALYKQDAERRLRASEEKYRSIFDNAIEGIFQTTPDGHFLTANRAMARMLGYDTPEELIESISNIEAQLYVDQDRRQEFARRLDEDGYVQGFETEIYRKDGSKGWASISSRAVRDAQGTLLYFEGRAEEITERKRLEEQIHQAQKMEAIGQLAGGIAHDFNNLLTVINGYSALLVDNRHPDDPDTEALAEIRNAGERAAVLTRQLLAFSRKQFLQLQVIDLNTLVSELAKMLRRLIGEHIVLTVDTDPSLDAVRVDPRQFEQVLLNLAVNARDAMTSGGTLTIGTQNVRLDANDAKRFTEMRPGRFVRLWVRDTGHGVPEALMSRIFEPFFTTKPLGEGTGLGLAVVHGIVRQNGGHIEVASGAGTGTTFNIYIPVAEGDVALKRPAAHPGLPKGDETILLVDDDEGVRALAASVLRSSGYTVLEAADGPAALAVARHNPDVIHLLLTDMGMPYMTGRQLSHVLRGERPDMRVLIVSGYAAESSAPAPGRAEHWLAKPFAPLTLAVTVRQVLDAPN
jgi:two-component system, cell cycle sensor histidine kinase and response regulator CckA